MDSTLKELLEEDIIPIESPEQLDLIGKLFRNPPGGFSVYGQGIEEEPIMVNQIPWVQFFSSENLHSEHGIDPRNMETMLRLMPSVSVDVATALAGAPSNETARQAWFSSLAEKKSALEKQIRTLDGLYRFTSSIESFQWRKLGTMTMIRQSWAQREAEFGRFLTNYCQNTFGKLDVETKKVLGSLLDLPERLKALNCFDKCPSRFWISKMSVNEFTQLMSTISMEQGSEDCKLNDNFVRILEFCIQQEAETLAKHVEISDKCHLFWFSMLEYRGFDAQSAMGDLQILRDLLNLNTEPGNDISNKFFLRRLNNYIQESGMLQLESVITEQHFLTLLHNTLYCIAGFLFYLLHLIGFSLFCCVRYSTQWNEMEMLSNKTLNNSLPTAESGTSEQTQKQLATMNAWHANYLRYFIAFVRLAELTELPCTPMLDRLVKATFILFPKLYIYGLIKPESFPTELGSKVQPDSAFDDFFSFKSFESFCSWKPDQDRGTSYVNLDWDFASETKKWREVGEEISFCPLHTINGTLHSDLVFPLSKPQLEIPHYFTPQELEKAQFRSTKEDARRLLALQREIQEFSKGGGKLKRSFGIISLKNAGLNAADEFNGVVVSTQTSTSNDGTDSAKESQAEALSVVVEEQENPPETDTKTETEDLKFEQSDDIKEEIHQEKEDDDEDDEEIFVEREQDSSYSDEEEIRTESGTISLPLKEPSTELDILEDEWPVIE